MNKLNALRLAVASSLVSVGAAHAALPSSVTTAIEAFQTDTLAAAGLVIAAGVAIWALMRLASKFGWR